MGLEGHTFIKKRTRSLAGPSPSPSFQKEEKHTSPVIPVSDPVTIQRVPEL